LINSWWLGKQRPDFGLTQVRTQEEIKIGSFYMAHYTYNRSEAIIRVIGIGDCNPGGRLRSDGVAPHTSCIEVEYFDVVHRHDVLFLQDYSIVPYNRNEWNLCNWLEGMDVETWEEAIVELKLCDNTARKVSGFAAHAAVKGV